MAVGLFTLEAPVLSLFLSSPVASCLSPCLYEFKALKCDITDHCCNVAFQGPGSSFAACEDGISLVKSFYDTTTCTTTTITFIQ